MKLGLKEQAVKEMIKECIQPLLELKKGFEKQENRADEITEDLPAEKYPSVNAVINFVKNKINEFRDFLNTAYVKLSEFNEYKITASKTFIEQSEFNEYKTTVENTFNKNQTEFNEFKSDSNITASASGKAIIIDSANAPLQQLKLYGHTEQNGTPTPDVPVPLVSVGDSGSFEVGVYGNNLLENKAVTTTKNGLTFTVNEDDKSITINGTTTATTVLNVNIDLKLDGTYILSGCSTDVSQQGVEWLFYDGAWKRDIGSGITFTTSKGKSQKCIINIPSGITITNATIYPMIRHLTDVDSTYEPCNKQTFTMPYTLASAKNNVRSEIDLTKGKFTEFAHKEVFDGSSDEKWETLSNGRVSITVDSAYAPNGNDLYNPGNILCSVANICSWATLENATSGCALGSTASRKIGFKIAGHTESVDAWKSYLASNPITVVYELKTPIETAISETELNAYRQLMTNKGTTTVLSEADTEVEYYRNTPNGQATGNIHTQVNADYFKLQQAIISLGVTE